MDKKKSAIINKLKEFKKQNNIDKMYLFGSAASGKTHKYSDIDLIVVSKKFRGKGILKRSPKLYTRWNMNYPVDLLCFTPEEFNKQKNHITLVREAIRNGIEIP